MTDFNASIKSGFVIVPKELASIDTKHRYLDIAVYYVLKYYCCNGKSRISWNKISAILGISKRDVNTAIKELKQLGHIDYIKLPSDKNDYEFNEYNFTSELKVGFEMIGKDLINQNLKAKQIGLLIYLKLASEFGWFHFNTIKEFAEMIGVTRQTASKYIKDLSAYIEPSKVGGLHFINQIFTFKEQNQTVKTNIEL